MANNVMVYFICRRNLIDKWLKFEKETETVTKPSKERIRICRRRQTNQGSHIFQKSLWYLRYTLCLFQSPYKILFRKIYILL